MLTEHIYGKEGLQSKKWSFEVNLKVNKDCQGLQTPNVGDFYRNPIDVCVRCISNPADGEEWQREERKCRDSGVLRIE